MTLQFFTDHCISNFIIGSLRDSGNKVFILKDCMPQESSDTAVIAMAQKLDCILVSLNGDFSDIVKFPPQNYKGIIGLQVRNHPEVIPAIMDRLKRYLAEHPTMEHYCGKLVLVEVHRIRIYQ